MPNNPKPTKLKLLQGNPGRRPINLNEPQPEQKIPTMPKWLKKFPIAIEEWKRESKILANVGLMTVAEEGDLAMRCFLAAKIQELAHQEDDKILGKIKNMITEYRMLGGILGLDPVNRTKLKSDIKQPVSKTESYRHKKKQLP